MRKIGITTTVPVEVVFAAGAIPVDLNNLFINYSNPEELIDIAEKDGFPANCCAWVKGIYGTVKKNNIKEIIGVYEGDCSQNGALLDILAERNIQIIPFSYPANPSREVITNEINKLAGTLGTTMEKAEERKHLLDGLRSLAASTDRMNIHCGKLDSRELFLLQLNLTDFYSDLNHCEMSLLGSLKKVDPKSSERSSAFPGKIPLGVVGVPTILDDLWDVIEDAGGRVLYHEVPHQFSMAQSLGKGLAETYRNFTYPYGAKPRIKEILRQIKQRKIKGVIHYVQSFCHRQMHDILLREAVDVPVLTIEADRPGHTDGRGITRIEAFLEQLSE